MAIASRSEIAAGAIGATLERAGADLRVLLHDSEKDIAAVTADFGELSRETGEILELVAVIVGCVRPETILSVMDRVQSLGVAARQFLQERLTATAGVLETATAESRMLGKLAELTRAQRAIARETQTLSVLTNIEVARLGKLGAGFQYLAHQLDEFSQSVAKGTKELASHTDERRSAIEETRRMLAIQIPRIRADLARMERDLGNSLALVNERLTALSRTPEQFRACVEEIACEVAGVVAAVQAQDITRQRVEHVEAGLRTIAGMARALEDGGEGQDAGSAGARSRVVAGLSIQVYQLRSIQEGQDGWVSQVRRCIDGILRTSCSDVVGIGPAVSREVGELSAQLGGVEMLEQESKAVNREIQSMLAGLSNLMELVGEHLERSTEVRDRLRLLTFNSIIEASHLGGEADAILEISQSIKRLATVWGEITDRSGQAMEEILHLIEVAQGSTRHFSDEGAKELLDAQAATKAGLKELSDGADVAAGRASGIEACTRRLQERVAAVGATADRLNGCSTRMDGVRREIEELRAQCQSDALDAPQLCDQVEVEAMFSAGYTTEIERAVMRAALTGAPMPERELSQAGNDVELF